MFTKMHESPLELVKDENGTSLASYVSTVIEKADAKGVPIIAIALLDVGTGDPKLALASNVDAANIPDILSQIGSLMRRQKPSYHEKTPINVPPDKVN